MSNKFVILTARHRHKLSEFTYKTVFFRSHVKLSIFATYSSTQILYLKLERFLKSDVYRITEFNLCSFSSIYLETIKERKRTECIWVQGTGKNILAQEAWSDGWLEENFLMRSFIVFSTSNSLLLVWTNRRWWDWCNMQSAWRDK
jgi:hypothetical protein